MYLFLGRKYYIVILTIGVEITAYSTCSASSSNGDTQLIGKQSIIQKCCPTNSRISSYSDGSLYCTSNRAVVKNTSQPSRKNLDEDIFTYFNVANIGFPNCSFIVLTNEIHEWFRFNNSTQKFEIATFYLVYPIWISVTDDYCIDDILFHKQSNKTIMGYPVTSPLPSSRQKLMVFCQLNGWATYITQNAIVSGQLFLAAIFNLGTIIIYLISWRIHKCSALMQFSVFVSDFLGNLSFGISVISYLVNDAVLWKDSLVATYLFSSSAFCSCYMVKYSILLAISIDISWSAWRAPSTCEWIDAHRQERIYVSVLISWFLPIILLTATYIMEYIYPWINEDDEYFPTNERYIRMEPRFYYQISRVIQIIEFIVTSFLFAYTVTVLKLQSKKIQNAEACSSHATIYSSYILYLKLFCAMEVPFTLNLMVVRFFSYADPMSYWWIILRAIYPLSALYAFLQFGCSARHRRYIKSIYSKWRSSFCKYYL